MQIIAIETSCDDTCLSVINDKFDILFERRISQIDIHKAYGGVVPELASRCHVEYLQIIGRQMVDEININNIDAVGVTHTPGLIGGLLAGVVFAKGIAHAYGKKIIGINHLEGHIESVNIGRQNHVQYPFLTLLVSGGHSQFVLVHNFGQYEIIGKTLDDSVGEAFDKTGKILGFEYPGGPRIEQYASQHLKRYLSENNQTHNLQEHNFPLIDIGSPMQAGGLNFSFSGFKTSVMSYVHKNESLLNDAFIAEICFSIQAKLSQNLAQKSDLAIKTAKNMVPHIRNFVLCGGVSANKTVNSKMQEICAKNDVTLHSPSLKYATDNATMIAFAAMKRLQLNLLGKLDLSPLSRSSDGRI